MANGSPGPALRAGLWIKAVDGALELAGGAFMLAGAPRFLRLLERAAARELSRDPGDFFATHAAALAHHLAGHRDFASIYLLSHGALKTGLAVSVLGGRLGAYPWAAAFLLIFAGYESYRFDRTRATWLIAAAAFDAAILVLLIREYRRRKSAA